MIFVGWYTQDYQKWTQTLIANLDGHGLEHDFVRVERPDGGWERRTMIKADQVLRAMDRHPGQTLVLLDVDCTVTDKAQALALADLRGDVAFYLCTKFGRRGKVRFSCRTGTMVFKPTPAARRFVETWRKWSEIAPPYAVDQDSLIVSLGKTPGCVFEPLDVRYCATRNDRLVYPWILHDCASEGGDKISSIRRSISRLLVKPITERTDWRAPE